MEYSIEEANKAHIAEIEKWLDTEEEAYSSAEIAYELNNYEGFIPPRGFRCNWDSVRKGWERGQPLFVIVVNGEAVGFLDGTNILEIRPDMRGKGYGKILAEFMLSREFDEGSSVVVIGIAPPSAVTFWRDSMAFTVQEDRQWYGGGIYAFKTLRRLFDLGEGERVPVSISFYSEKQGHSSHPKPFKTFSGLGERLPDGAVQLPERVYGFNEKTEQIGDCFIGIELDGRKILFDKAKYDESEIIGVQSDKGGFYFLDRIGPT